MKVLIDGDLSYMKRYVDFNVVRRLQFLSDRDNKYIVDFESTPNSDSINGTSIYYLVDEYESRNSACS